MRSNHVVGPDVGATSAAAFDATDFERLSSFFDELPPIDHVLVTGPGPYYAPLSEFDFDEARRDVEAHLFLPMPEAPRVYDEVAAYRPNRYCLIQSLEDAVAIARDYASRSSSTERQSYLVVEVLLDPKRRFPFSLYNDTALDLWA